MERIERYLAKVDRRGPDDCWPWTGKVQEHGYGVFWDGTREVRAHRWGHEALVGPIPEGQIIRHRCDVRVCQNPAHWQLGTQADNVRDMIERGRKVVTPMRGEANGNARLTVAQVQEIRLRYAQGGETYYTLGAEFGITPTAVGHIIQRRKWASVA